MLVRNPLTNNADCPASVIVIRLVREHVCVPPDNAVEISHETQGERNGLTDKRSMSKVGTKHTIGH